MFEELLNYRFHTSSDLNGHTVGNLLLTAMTNITGNMNKGIKSLGKVLNLKGNVIPLSEDNSITLMGEMEDGEIVEGEHNITEKHKKIKRVFYKNEPIVSRDAIKAIKEADKEYDGNESWSKGKKETIQTFIICITIIIIISCLIS